MKAAQTLPGLTTVVRIVNNNNIFIGAQIAVPAVHKKKQKWTGQGQYLIKELLKRTVRHLGFFKVKLLRCVGFEESS